MAGACYALPAYPITLIGMPTGGCGFASLNKKTEATGFSIYYTTPYFNDKTDEFSKTLTRLPTRKNIKGKPTDMAFKGFEAVYSFTKLLAMYPGNFMSHINDKKRKSILRL